MIPENIQIQLDRLCDELCTMERDAGFKSVLILHTPAGKLRIVDGKPTQINVSDDTLVEVHLT